MKESKVKMRWIDEGKSKKVINVDTIIEFSSSNYHFAVFFTKKITIKKKMIAYFSLYLPHTQT